MSGGARSRLRPDSNGGVRIERGSGSAYDITACIAAGARRWPTRRPRPTASGSSSTATASASPASTSERARPELERAAHRHRARRRVDRRRDDQRTDRRDGRVGHVRRCARRTGRSALDDVSGTVDARASNGPISVEGGSGEFNVETANGPIQVRLAGRRWDGHLDARAANGPLTLQRAAELPVGRRDLLVVSLAVELPRRRPAATAIATGTSARAASLGVDPVVVKLTTVNGPVTINER